MNAVTEKVSLSSALDMSNYWMPFTANKQFKAAPRLLQSAKGMYYTTVDGRSVMDGCAGLWCVNAGHGREEIIEAVYKQMTEMANPGEAAPGGPPRAAVPTLTAPVAAA